MNKDLIEINNNCGAVSDENGDIKIIKKDSEEKDFLEILTTENEIENIFLHIEKLKKEISNIEHKKEKIDLILMIPIVSGISMLILKMLPPIIILYTIIASYTLSTPLYLQKSYYSKKKTLLIEKIQELNKKEKKLTKKLRNIKYITNYRIKNKSVDIKKLLIELNNNNFENSETTLERINTIEREQNPEIITIPSVFQENEIYVSKRKTYVKKLVHQNTKMR